MRLVFMGTPQFSVPFLQALQQAGHEIAAVYTQPPQQSGRRGLKKKSSPVQQAAETLNIPVHCPKTLRDAAEQMRFAALKADAAVIVAYGLILPEAILKAVRFGCYNAHASLLPRWRGAAPVQRAIAAGDKETGIVIMRMDKGLDTGDILCAKAQGKSKPQPFLHKIPIAEDTLAGDVFAALSAAGAALMVKAVAVLAEGAYCLQPQAQKGVCYAHKIEKTEMQINWNRAAEDVHKHICSLSPAQAAWCEMQIGGKRERVKVLASHCAADAELLAMRRQNAVLFRPLENTAAGAEANHPQEKNSAAFSALAVQCAQGAVFLTQLQKAGGKPLSASAFLRGAAVQAVY